MKIDDDDDEDEDDNSGYMGLRNVPSPLATPANEPAESSVNLGRGGGDLLNI